MKLGCAVLLMAWAAYAQTPVAAKLCEVVEQPDRFKDKLVSVRAEAVVGFETQALIDGSCPDDRIWFELDAAYNADTRAWAINEFNSRKKVTASFVGLFETGDCYGHSCFSKSQLRVQRVVNVTAVERRLAADFSAYDCSLLIRALKVHFQKGHIDNIAGEPWFMPSLQVVLTGPDGDAIVPEGYPIFQIATAPGRLKVLKPGKDGVFRLSSLSSGAYAFTAVAQGFQSVTGCVVTTPGAPKREPLRIELPLGV